LLVLPYQPLHRVLVLPSRRLRRVSTINHLTTINQPIPELIIAYDASVRTIHTAEPIWGMMVIAIRALEQQRGRGLPLNVKQVLERTTEAHRA
jgi:hypothetical protein